MYLIYCPQDGTIAQHQSAQEAESAAREFAEASADKRFYVFAPVCFYVKDQVRRNPEA